MILQLRMGGWRVGRKTYRVREKRLCREADDVSITTAEAWIEQLAELCQGYEPQIVLNLDELGIFFKDLPEKGLTKKKKAT